MLTLARKAGSFRRLMATSVPPSSPRSLARSYMQEAKEFAKKFFLDENMIQVEDSYWKFFPANSKPKTLVTCEHSSNRFPQNLKKELDLIDTHWAVDIGAEEVAAALSCNMQLPLLSSRISRLVIDVNRPVCSDTLFRHVADGKVVHVNDKMTPEDKQDRIDRYWKPYRHELDAMMQDEPSIEMILSIHSFTPNYEGNIRDCEIGVLYTESKGEASVFLTEFAAKGYKVVENEPWPASLCDIAVPVTSAGKSIVILEIRNDLASNPIFRKRIAKDIQDILESLKLA